MKGKLRHRAAKVPVRCPLAGSGHLGLVPHCGHHRAGSGAALSLLCPVTRMKAKGLLSISENVGAEHLSQLSLLPSGLM